MFGRSFLKMLFLSAFMCGLSGVYAADARANEQLVRACGVPTTYSLETKSYAQVCDIYTRQLLYRDEAIKLRQQILDRTVSFQAPREALYKQYRENLQALYDTITEDNIPSFFARKED